MAKSLSFKERWQLFCQQVRTAMDPVIRAYNAVANFFKVIISYIVRLYKFFLAAPVVVEAARLAQYNYDHLPELVGLDLQATGEYAMMISRDAAVLMPLVVTGACLVLMFCSRRAIYPWIISVFSLVLPVLIMVTNIFPA